MTECVIILLFFANCYVVEAALYLNPEGYPSPTCLIHNQSRAPFQEDSDESGLWFLVFELWVQVGKV